MEEFFQRMILDRFLDETLQDVLEFGLVVQLHRILQLLDYNPCKLDGGVRLQDKLMRESTVDSLISP